MPTSPVSHMSPGEFQILAKENHAEVSANYEREFTEFSAAINALQTAKNSLADAERRLSDHQLNPNKDKAWRRKNDSLQKDVENAKKDVDKKQQALNNANGEYTLAQQQMNVADLALDEVDGASGDMIRTVDDLPGEYSTRNSDKPWDLVALEQEERAVEDEAERAAAASRLAQDDVAAAQEALQRAVNSPAPRGRTGNIERAEGLLAAAEKRAEEAADKEALTGAALLNVKRRREQYEASHQSNQPPRGPADPSRPQDVFVMFDPGVSRRFQIDPASINFPDYDFDLWGEPSPPASPPAPAANDTTEDPTVSSNEQTPDAPAPNGGCDAAPPPPPPPSGNCGQGAPQPSNGSGGNMTGGSTGDPEADAMIISYLMENQSYAAELARLMGETDNPQVQAMLNSQIQAALSMDNREEIGEQFAHLATQTDNLDLKNDLLLVADWFLQSDAFGNDNDNRQNQMRTA